MIIHAFLLPFLALSRAVLATPFPSPIAPQACLGKSHSAIFDALEDHKPESNDFCSIYLGVPAVTSIITKTAFTKITETVSLAIATKTVDTTTNVDVINTTLVTATETDDLSTSTKVDFSTLTATAIETDTTTTTVAAGAIKARTVHALPPYLSKYAVSTSAISAACSCLAITSTTTTTVALAKKTTTISYTKTVSTNTATTTTTVIDDVLTISLIPTITTTQEIDTTITVTTSATATVTSQACTGCACNALTGFYIAEYGTNIPPGGANNIQSTPGPDNAENCCQECANGEGSSVSCASWYWDPSSSICYWVVLAEAGNGDGSDCPYGNVSFGGYPPTGGSALGGMGPCAV